MVTDGPIRGAALGGASAGVGGVCQAVADRLAADPGLLTSVWLERGGRLRCVAGQGDRPGRVGVSPTAGAVGATFTADTETVVPEDSGRRERDARPLGEACFPIRAHGCVIGVLQVRLTGLLAADDLDRVRRAAADLGVQIAALGAPPSESAAQRMLRHTASVSALDDPAAIASALLAAAIDLMGLESAALVGPACMPRVPPGASGEHRGEPATSALTTSRPTAAHPVTAIGPADRPATAIGAAGHPATANGPAGHPVTAIGPAGHPATAIGAAGHPATAIGPLGHVLATLPAPVLASLTHPTADPAEALVLHPDAEPAHAALAPLRAHGIRTLVAVAVVAQGRPRGILVLAGRARRAVAIDDVELLELLAAHAATCLRIADLMRSLRERAATDPLTGLGHYATFHEALARTHRRPRTAVVLVDVDGFKRLNDTFGHQHGDQVLRAIAAALDSALRRGDSLFRIGGDEFAALLAVTDADEAHEAGSRLRAAVADARLGVTVSIGVAVPLDGEADGALLARADRALYRVKAAGRDGVAVAAGSALDLAPPIGTDPTGLAAGEEAA
jgi:diguanylate cyclase (GGDEF)-like protein